MAIKLLDKEGNLIKVIFGGRIDPKRYKDESLQPGWRLIEISDEEGELLIKKEEPSIKPGRRYDPYEKAIFSLIDLLEDELLIKKGSLKDKFKQKGGH